MKRYWSYLKYLLRHKWYVFLFCKKHRILFRGILHDFSKFRPSEFIPYARFFYNPDGSPRKDHDEACKKAFDYAWLLHQKRNPHHWQWWILAEDDGGSICLPMSLPALREMICDWMGAGLAQGYGPQPLECRKWYLEHKDEIQLHPVTQRWVKVFLGLIP